MKPHYNNLNGLLKLAINSRNRIEQEPFLHFISRTFVQQIADFFYRLQIVAVVESRRRPLCAFGSEKLGATNEFMVAPPNASVD